MSGLERIKDFLRWLGEVDKGLGSPKAPSLALGLQDGAPVRYRWNGAQYNVAGPVAGGDSGPIYFNHSNLLTVNFDTPIEAAIYGPSAARIEAAKACPFPLEDGAMALTPKAGAWRETGATWSLTATTRARIAEARAALIAAGARPGDAMTVVDGAPLSLAPARGPNRLAIAAALAVFAGVGAAISVTYGAAQIESQAQSRLTEARRALDAAEAQAATAAATREAAASPLRQAQIVGAALAQAPSVATRLADLIAATPDDAYAKRLTIRPDAITGEFISPDAAALAARIGGAPSFAAARLKGPARTEAAGLQRATIDIAPEVAR